MPQTDVTLKSSEVSPALMQTFHAAQPWAAFEAAALRHLQQGFAAAHVQTVEVDITQTLHPGPLLMKFKVTSGQLLVSSQLKPALRQ